MPKVGFITGVPATEFFDDYNIEWVQRRAKEIQLQRLYNSTSGTCSVCGTHISTAYGEPLGRYFVMDTDGRFYCMHCDKHFGEGDERIYEPEEG